MIFSDYVTFTFVVNKILIMKKEKTEGKKTKTIEQQLEDIKAQKEGLKKIILGINKNNKSKNKLT